tara:strand:+ start:387 stop:563 length:177 start_codon:yes stop_codon:yes gene_type:complete
MPRASTVELIASEVTLSKRSTLESINQIRVSDSNKIEQKFKPSEEISEDLAIPFPVDI